MDVPKEVPTPIVAGTRLALEDGTVVVAEAGQTYILVGGFHVTVPASTPVVPPVEA